VQFNAVVFGGKLGVCTIILEILIANDISFRQTEEYKQSQKLLEEKQA
jgi:hypothetical protein